MKHIALNTQLTPMHLHLYRCTRRTALAAAGMTALLSACAQPVLPAAQDDNIAGRNAGSTVVFATPAAGRAVLEADDEYMRAAGDFQRRSIMGRAVQGQESPAPLDDFRRWSGDAARSWQPAQRERWRAAAAVVLPAFEALQIPLPPQVLLVATNGQESASAPHTRANAVMLPLKDGEPTARDAFLLAHELWHVASRHAPALAGRLYAVIGFEPMPELRYPPAWAALRLANPDAVDNRHAMALQLDGRNVQVTPLLVAKRTTLATSKETFFDALDVRLLEVTWTPGAATSQAVIGDDGQPRWHPIGPAYLARLGGNTGYVIHPEETIADNIALLAMQQAGQPGPTVRNPELLARLRAVLLAPH